MKTNIKIIIGVAIGILISVVSCYALAENLINSKDVVYEDNSNLFADNVQDAIDGTCSKIDTRLSDIEDNLYTVKNMYKSTSFTTTISSSYTGISFTLPAKSFCSITVCVYHNNARPNGLALSRSKEIMDCKGITSYESNSIGSSLCLTLSEYTENARIYYVWASTVLNGVVDNADYSGFCATKYKQ